jgi:hypothetical protein
MTALNSPFNSVVLTIGADVTLSHLLVGRGARKIKS